MDLLIYGRSIRIGEPWGGGGGGGGGGSFGGGGGGGGGGGRVGMPMCMGGREYVHSPSPYIKLNRQRSRLNIWDPQVSVGVLSSKFRAHSTKQCVMDLEPSPSACAKAAVSIIVVEAVATSVTLQL
eukprot:SAG31_NODE_4130_length_3555_cov_7.058449_5_plen_126_part_00